MKNKYLDSYKNKKVLVTGSTGFKGSWLCLWLNSIGAKVIGIGLKPEKNSIIFNALKLKKLINQNFIDIRNFERLNSVIKKEKPEIIFHLAAQSIVSDSIYNPYETFETNIRGSLNLLESYKKNNIENLIYITSDKCYQNNEWEWSYRENDIIFGDDPYSASKSCAEIIFHSYYKNFFKKNKYLKMASARAGNVIGGGDFKKNRIVPDIIKNLQKNKNIKIRNPRATRPWQNVLEPLNGYLLLGSKIMENNLDNNIYPSWNFGPNPENCKTVKNVSELMVNIWNNKKSKIIIERKQKFKEAGLLMLNNEKAKTELGWFPKLDLDNSLVWTSSWYKKYYESEDMNEFSMRQINNYNNL